MKISREWLGDYVDLTDLSDEEIAGRLTSIGHAVEGIEQHEGSAVFEIEFTTNRVDAMSHLGLARELAAALGRDLLTGTYEVAPAQSPGPVRDVPISIESPDLCDRYTGLVIEGVKIKPSGHRIRARLEAVGLRPLNNVVDITNYVMMAVGHPLHAFDLDKVGGPAIRVRAATAGEKVRTLDGVDRTLDPSICVIGDATTGSALGGIMGGARSEITDSTRNVLLECAHFVPGAIRRGARRLGMKTDASYRFERGVDPNDTVAAIEQAANLVISEAGGVRGEPIDILAGKAEPRRLVLRTTTLETATAGIVGEGYVLGLFTRLGFSPARVHDGVEVFVPTYRGDLSEEYDLVEEVLRFYGFDNIPAVLPRMTTGDTVSDTTHRAEDRLRDVLAGCGLTEVVTYAFIHPEHNALLSEEKPFDITNALNENIASMRLSLVPGLLEAAAHNRSHGNRDGGLFEIGRTYHRQGDGIREHNRAGLVLFGGVQNHWSDARRPWDFFDAKGIIEAVAARHHLAATFRESRASWLKPGQGAAARIGEHDFAEVGFVTKEIADRFGIKGDVIVAEMDVTLLAESAAGWKMDAPSRFPGVPMVLGLMHGPAVTYEQIVSKIRELNPKYLQEIGIRDRYFPEDSAEVKTLLGMWYQAADRSLTQDEIAEIHQNLGRRLGQSLPVTVLGLEEQKQETT
jgi:phenylalanyl-tRNA synthetase beta chain